MVKAETSHTFLARKWTLYTSRLGNFEAVICDFCMISGHQPNKGKEDNVNKVGNINLDLWVYCFKEQHIFKYTRAVMHKDKGL